MKKVFKILFLVFFISIITYEIYNYKTEIINFVSDVKVEIYDYFANETDSYYTEKEIQSLLKTNDTVINGEYIGKLDNYYYEQLDTYSKIIYKSILNNIDELKKGEYEIEIPNSLADVVKDEKEGAINLVFQNAWNAFRLDHPEIFDINIKNIYLTTKTTTVGKKTRYEFFLNSKEKRDIEKSQEILNKVEQKKEEIIKDIKDDNNFSKILNVHNWLIDNIEYDKTMNNENNNNIYGALVENTVVCEGYAKSFKYLLDELEIPCVIVCGEGVNDKGEKEKHAWNEVYLNGNWYSVDVTWDDPLIIGGGKLTKELRYKYFLIGKSEIEKNHFQNGKMSECIDEIEFKYPELSENNYK